MASQCISSRLSKFIPELVELGIMRAVRIVAELMKHRVEDLIIRIEISVSIRPAKPQLHVHPTTHIQTQETPIRWTELGEKLHPPPALAHDGLNLVGDPVEDLPGLVFRRLPLQGLDFPYLVEIALVHLLLLLLAVSGRRKSPNFYRLPRRAWEFS